MRLRKEGCGGRVSQILELELSQKIVYGLFTVVIVNIHESSAVIKFGRLKASVHFANKKGFPVKKSP